MDFGGSQRHEFDLHLSGWDYETLKEVLEKIGFKNIRRYLPMKTEHFYIDDYSMAMIPHLNKTDGINMSLNIEADKIF